MATSLVARYVQFAPVSFRTLPHLDTTIEDKGRNFRKTSPIINMASTVSAFLSGVHRNWTMFNPPAHPKEQNALKFGILGAANIA